MNAIAPGESASDGGWNPISTAPKNGKRVDLGMRYRNRTGEQFMRAPDCYWHKKAGRWMCKWHCRDGFSAIRAPFEPTHWRWPPPAPSSLIEHLKKPIGVEEEGVLTRRECGVAPAGLTGHQAFETSGKERG